jgi:indolepyruvate ferredoxin oxidoreductase, beta subunit
MKNKTFNIIIAGVGGQGVITLLSIIDEAAFIEGCDVKSSELHGLSQRGGAVEAHLRFGKKVYSPLIKNGLTDLVIGLESAEALRAFSHSGPETKFLVNDQFVPFDSSLLKEEVQKKLQTLGKNLHFIQASEICNKELQNEVVSSIYLLGYAIHKNLLPLKEESVLRAIKNTVPEKYHDLNVKAFNLAKSQHGK